MPLFDAPVILFELSREVETGRTLTEEDFPPGWAVLGECDCRGGRKKSGWVARGGSKGAALESPAQGSSTLLIGSRLWRDYRLSAVVRLEPQTVMAELLFRFGDSSGHYSLGIWKEGLVLAKRDAGRYAALDVLAQALEPLRPYRIDIDLVADRILVEMDGKTVFDTTDGFRQSGGAGVRSDGPASFSDLVVCAMHTEAQRLKLVSKEAKKTTRDVRAASPAQLMTVSGDVDFGFVAFVDMDADGSVEILNVHPGRAGAAAAAAVQRFDGKVVWQWGELRRRPHANLPPAFAVEDLDGNGRLEVVLAGSRELAVLAAADGALKCRRELKDIFAAEYLGGPLALAVLREGPRPKLILRCGESVAALDASLEVLFRLKEPAGGFAPAVSRGGPAVFVAGRSLVLAGPMGKEPKIWPLRDFEPPAQAALVFRPAAQRCDWLVIGSHGGLTLLNLADPKVFSALPYGHVIALAGGAFRAALGPLQFVAATAQGRLMILDERLNPLYAEEVGRVEALTPLNWTGHAEESILFATHARPAVVLDGFGRDLFFIDRPAKRYHQLAVADVIGDARDEIILVAHDRLEIFGHRGEGGPARPASRRRLIWPQARPCSILSVPGE